MNKKINFKIAKVEEIYEMFKIYETNNSANLRDWQIRLNNFLLLSAKIFVELRESGKIESIESPSFYNLMHFSNLKRYIDNKDLSNELTNKVNNYLLSLPGNINNNTKISNAEELHDYYLMNLMVMLDLEHKYQNKFHIYT